MVRPRFDPTRQFCAMRSFTYLGKAYEKGDPFSKEGVAVRNLKTLYDTRNLEFAPDDTASSAAAEPAAAFDPVTIKKVGKNYLISAAWLAEPLKETSKAKADAAAEKVRADGAPLGWIEGGTETTITGGDGGWYEVGAPWLDQPEKVQGREAAEALQRELHDAGRPADVVTVEPGQGQDEFVIRIAGSDETETVIGEELALARADEIRAELREIEPLDPIAAMVIVGVGETDWSVTAPWLTGSETFDTAEAAEARQAELRTAGPPEGWSQQEPQAPEATA